MNKPDPDSNPDPDPNPDPKLRSKYGPDPKKKNNNFGSTTLEFVHPWDTCSGVKLQGLHNAVLEVLHRQPSIKWKSCAPIGIAGYCQNCDNGSYTFYSLDFC
jgi:hypothetical protein